MSQLGLVFTLPFALATAVGFAAQEASQSAAEKSQEDRVTETTDSEESQILEELAKLRKEIQTLRIEVGDLRRKVGDIHRVAVRPAPTQPPAPETVDLDENRALGSADAEVAIVEFSDYQCPYCQRFFLQTFPELEKSYIETGKVRFYFRDFPLERIHPQARAAAIAANCAARQGAYWDMHHGLFENQKKLGSELYEELAKEIGLDMAAFQSCLVEPSESKKVDQELAYGQSLTVQGTPHYFVGRIEGGQLVDVKRVNGAQPIEAFSKVIDSLLQ